MDEGMDNEIYNIAKGCGSRQLCIFAAKFLESRHKLEKAVLLFDKGGNAKRAMDIAMANNMSEIMS